MRQQCRCNEGGRAWSNATHFRLIFLVVTNHSLRNGRIRGSDFSHFCAVVSDVTVNSIINRLTNISEKGRLPTVWQLPQLFGTQTRPKSFLYHNSQICTAPEHRTRHTVQFCTNLRQNLGQKSRQFPKKQSDFYNRASLDFCKIGSHGPCHKSQLLDRYNLQLWFQQGFKLFLEVSWTFFFSL